MPRCTPAPRLRHAGLVFSAAFLFGNLACGCEPHDARRQADETGRPDETPTSVQAEVLARLMPDPRIVNTHEHLLGTSKSVAKLEEANRRAGVASTVLVGSARYTFYLDKSGFVDHHENNNYLCELARENPGKYHVLVTFDPEEEDITRKLEEYLGQGAIGVKLYAGHGGRLGDGRPFHVCPLDDPKLLPLYEYCEVHRVPICLHVNMGKYADEARRVFDRFPGLRVIIPHFALWSSKNRRGQLDELLTRYPQLLTDLSYGWWYSDAGLKRYHEDTQSFREFMIKHQDRILFATDVVITGSAKKSSDALTDFFLAYRSALELPEYDFVDRHGKQPKEYHFRGLALPEDVLRKIYHQNWERLLEDCGLSVSGEERGGGTVTAK